MTLDVHGSSLFLCAGGCATLDEMRVKKASVPKECAVGVVDGSRCVRLRV